ncbi:MAG: Biotin/lipoyl attachment domain-containing protein [Thermotoga sp. 50_1627]|uniref:biotin/lipoyl-containing protein n=1 Tax=Pseudothermotoga sp. TaxID=2033661 RepID=UPI00076CCF2F|nr:MAG: Biotin/lipoyl attachment domain-containing protein [Thermotoga sp. 50_64]KUK25323.1 MAG: Biotin/lipoyl attachment domain-containing protein [Thermotoga sp. 50_1627]MBC7117006.1 biotin/lipoyl-binding protein [Pseudothermotoga sp.]MDK2923036.1 glutaconyl-CoA/methylmalonyl-CoA decarboxylase subunit gamma [Pseudothermotoga sp.]HBT39893.1 acetyl-CoA carboxylase biotin carboxyl carrier protein subunit [Pseudothermotoga sp.]
MARKFRVVINNKEYIVEVEEIGGSPIVQSVQPIVEKPQVVEKPQQVQTQAVKSEPVRVEQPKEKPTPKAGGLEVKAPMSGLIVRVNVSEGQQVKRGQTLLVLEAMKMENDIISEHDGTVLKVLVKEGDSVETEQTLLVIG